MASTSEKTFGSRLYNAEQMATNVSGYTGYVPLTPETAIPAFTTFTDTLQTDNDAIATALSQYAIAVDDRKDQFLKSPTSLNRTLSPILAYTKAKFGKESSQVDEITRLVNLIRGESTRNLSRNDEGEFVSNSHRSYGSQTQYFADIIAMLTSFGVNYSPTNTAITIPNLKIKQQELDAANTQVTTTYSVLKPKQDNRKIQYNTLSQRAQTIKETVKSQYGSQSSEYGLIKGYKI